MKTRTWILCVALASAAPVAADPPGGHPGRGQGAQGKGAKATQPGHGHGKPEQARAPHAVAARANAQVDPVDRHRPVSTPVPIDRTRPPSEGVVRGPGQGRANSQGPAHANPRAIAAVCRNPNAAAHSVLGSRCDVVAYRDPVTGGTVYTQPGMEPAPAAPPLPTRTPGRERDNDELEEREVRPR